MNLATSIATTRQNVQQAQQSYSDKDWNKDRISKPWMWYLMMESRFDEQFRDQRTLLERGQVVWGAIIQANEHLFQPKGGSDKLPAAVMYSLESFYDDNPEVLGDQASGLYDLKG
jgi:hypothetical protein